MVKETHAILNFIADTIGGVLSIRFLRMPALLSASASPKSRKNLPTLNKMKASGYFPFDLVVLLHQKE